MHPSDRQSWAAIDVGTNSVLLLVARVAQSGALEILEDQCQMPRLGEGLAHSGRIAPAAAQRALATLESFARRLAQLGQPAARTRAVGTAVLRRASNAAEFVAAARARTGLAIEVVSEGEEARLGRLAVLGECAGADAPIVDVGGGSSEFTGVGGEPRFSIPVGAVVLHERHPGPADFEALCAEARAAAEDLPARAAAGAECVLLGGSAVNLACLELGLQRFDHLRAEGARIAPASARRWAERLHALPLERRSELPIERERAAILPAGLACTAALLERLAPASLRVSGRGLRFGVLRELAGLREP